MIENRKSNTTYLICNNSFVVDIAISMLRRNVFWLLNNIRLLKVFNEDCGYYLS